MTNDTIERNGFKKGWMLAQNRHLNKIRAEIMGGLSINSRQLWHNRLNGKDHTLSLVEADFIEKVFRKYGITDIWDK